MVTIDCEATPEALKLRLKSTFSRAGFQLRNHASEEQAEYQTVFLEETSSPDTITEILSKFGSAKCIVFWRGTVGPEQMKAIYSGATLSVHPVDSHAAPQDAVDRIIDDQFLQPILTKIRKEDTESPLSQLADSANKALAIIDRSFRCVYRNQRHLALTGGEERDGRLCWHDFRSLSHRIHPCERCPTHSLFQTGSTPTRRTVVRISGSNGVVCKRLDVFPLLDPRRGRVVASLELSEEIDLRKEIPEDLLDSTLVAMLNASAGFTRARVLVYLETSKALKGFMEVSADPRGRIGVDFTRTVLPAGKYNAKVFKERVPIIRHLGEEPFEEEIYGTRFGKDRAPVWGEFPLLRGNKILGKLVVDKYQAEGTPDQDLTDSQLKQVKPFADLAAETLPEVDSYTSFVEGELTNICRRRVVEALFEARSPDSVREQLVESLTTHLRHCVLSAFIRVPDPDQGYLDATRFGAGLEWRVHAAPESRPVTAPAYRRWLLIRSNSRPAVCRSKKRNA